MNAFYISMRVVNVCVDAELAASAQVSKKHKNTQQCKWICILKGWAQYLETRGCDSAILLCPVFCTSNLVL